MAADVFISHSAKDKTVAEAVCAMLEAGGIRCWIAPRDILPGHTWANAILEGISQSRAMLLVFSAAANESPHVRREVERAVSHAIPVVPVRIEDVMPVGDLEYFLSSAHWMDALPPPAADHLQKLTARMRAMLDLSPPPTPVERPIPTSVGPPPAPTPVPGPHRRWAVPALVLMIVLAVAAGLVYRSLDSRKTTSPPPPSAPPAAIASTAPLQPFVNSLDMKFVPIPAGEFQMGSPVSEPGHNDDEIVHRVKITKPFYMGATHVTVEQFSAFAKDGYKTDAEKQGFSWAWKQTHFEHAEGLHWGNPGFRQGGHEPVVDITWFDAAEFCAWLNKKEPGQQYRLPTEAEWEYACRAGTQTAYPWGDSPADGKGWANCSDLKQKESLQIPDARWIGYPWDDGYVNTSPVASFRSNAFGLYDMIGNALEWVADVYGRYPGNATDPAGPLPTGVMQTRVIRGGSWDHSPRFSRSAFRLSFAPDFCHSGTGFRVACDAEKAASP